MEDMYIKPGNQDRGWNDPPQFSYGLQVARGPHRSHLNRRAAPPPAPPTAPPNDPPLPLSAPPLPLPGGVAPPPLCPARPLGSLAPPPPPPGPISSQRQAESSQSEREPDVEAVMSVLQEALETCRHSITQQVCDDVMKRLRLLEAGWRKLSSPVQRRMEHLSQELQAGRWDSADELHRCLMVDHVTEVSQWMVAVKRLIAEARKLRPEPPEPQQRPSEPIQNPLDPKKLIQNPLDPIQNPLDPIQNPLDPKKLIQNPLDLIQNPLEPIQNPLDPIQNPL